MAVNPNQAAYNQNLANRKAIEDSLKNPGAVTINGLPTVTPGPAKPTAPTAPQTNPFTAPEYNYMTYDQAKTQAGDRLKPLMENETRGALKNVSDQAMGSGFYGQLPTVQYSADTAAQIASNYAAQQAQLAQQLQDTDYERGERNYDKAYQLWRANTDDGFTKYGLERNAFESDRGYDRGVFESDRAFDFDKQQFNVSNGWEARKWQHGLDREKIDDSRYKDETAYARKMDSIKLARSGGGGGRGGGSGKKSSTTDPRAGRMDYQLSRVESFRSKGDAEAQFFAEKPQIVKEVGLEGFNYLINYTRSLPDNFSGGTYRVKR